MKRLVAGALWLTVLATVVVGAYGIGTGGGAGIDTVTALGGYRVPASEVRLSGAVVRLRSTRTMPPGSDVSTSGNAIADTRFDQTADCRLREYLGQAGRLTSRLSSNVILGLTQGYISCVISGASHQIHLCKGGIIFTNGNVMHEFLAGCTGDPFFEVAVYRGELTVTDPAGRTFTLSQLEEFSCNPDRCVFHPPVRASFTSTNLADFEQEGDELLGPPATTTTAER